MSTMRTSGIGSLLKRFRQEAGLTQEALAEQAGLSVRGIQDLERGVSRAPRTDTLDLLATALGLGSPDRAKLVAAVRSQRRARTRSVHPAQRVSAPLIPLVGRTGELALLEHFLAGEGDGTEAAPVLLLAGEPGIGKTRLLEVAAQTALGRGWRVLTGGCSRRGGQGPYAPVLDALVRHLSTLTPDCLSVDLAGCTWLVQLLPELAGVLEPLPMAVPPDRERRLTFAAVARFLANVAGPAGTLLILDDLQWAGPDALDLLASLLHRAGSGQPPGLSFRVVGAYRHTEVGPADPFGLLLADLARGGLVSQHTVGPLDPAEAEALLTDLLIDVKREKRATIGHVLERAGGVPFFLVTYAQALKHGNSDAVPWDLAQCVRQRVALVPEAGDLLGAAAIVGRQIPRPLLVEVTGQSEEGVLAGLEAACKARLLLEDGEDAYAFAHDVIRDVVEADLGAARRAVLHRRVATALEHQPRGASVELLAHHFRLSDASDQAAKYLELAGNHAASQHAHTAAEGYYQDALTRLDQLDRGHDAARVREQLGEILCRTGRYDAALQVLEQAAEGFHAAGATESLVRVTVRICGVHGPHGTPREGVARLRALLQCRDMTEASPLLATAYMALSHLLYDSGDYLEALGASERAAELAAACGDERTRAEAEWTRASSLSALGHRDEALQLGRQTLSLIETVGDAGAIARANHDLAHTLAMRGSFETARMHIDRALWAARQLDNPGQLAFVMGIRGWLAFLCGDWRQARLDLEQAVAESRLHDRSWYSPYPLLFLADLCLAEGHRTAAAVVGEDAVALAQEGMDLQALRWASAVLAEVAVLEGHPEAAIAHLVPLLDRPGLEEFDVTVILPVLAWAYLMQSQVQQAVNTAELALTRAGGENDQLVVVEALRIKSMIALRCREWAQAKQILDRGLELARAMPYPYAEARLLYLDGERLAAQSDPVGARAQLEAALSLFQRLGAEKDREWAEKTLAVLSRQDRWVTAESGRF